MDEQVTVSCAFLRNESSVNVQKHQCSVFLNTRLELIWVYQTR